MAERRMFAKKIVESDAFLDMPHSTQTLYFHLAMEADDDGFVNSPRKIMRATRTNTDDMKLLITEGFVHEFDTGVVCIADWRINNHIQRDRYKPTVYQEEFSTIHIKESGAYSRSADTSSIQPVSKLDTDNIQTENQPADNAVLDQEEKLDSDTETEPQNGAQSPHTDYVFYQETYNNVCRDLAKLKIMSDSRKRAIRTFQKQFTAEKFVEICEKAAASDFLCGRIEGKYWKAGFDFLIKPSNAVKVLEGLYDNRKSDRSYDGWDYINAVARGEML